MCSARNKVGQTSDSSWSGAGGPLNRGAHWSGVNIAAMVVGFVFFWPVGLFVLYWILTGREAVDIPAAAKAQWAKMRGDKGMRSGSTDNVVFNDYQQTQYDRIREIKDEMKARAARFTEFRQDAKRRADQDEFNQFMASSPIRTAE